MNPRGHPAGGGFAHGRDAEVAEMLPLEEPIKAYWLGLSDRLEDGRRWKGVFLLPIPRNSKRHHPAALPRLSWNVFKACEKPLGTALNPEDLCLS